MLQIKQLMERLRTEVSGEKYAHSVNTMKTAGQIAGELGADPVKCRIAGLLHDCAKSVAGKEAVELCIMNGFRPDDILTKEPHLLHGYLGRLNARVRFGIDDNEILDAIEHHIMGRPGMTATEKVVFIADYIEPDRSFRGVVKLRELVTKDIDLAIITAIDGTIKKILSSGDLLHPKIIETRNYYISIKRRP